MAITAAQVKELRERTGAGMMECKKALIESNGDIDAAIEAMRKSGQAKADKKAGRIAAEGRIEVASNNDTVVIIEVNCETDFVGKDENFVGFVRRCAEVALERGSADVAALMAENADGQTLEEARAELITKIGENVQVRRFSRMQDATTAGHYLHGSRIGVVVVLQGGTEDLARDLAMHIAASRPVCIDSDQVPAELLEKEREIFRAQALESGKPPEIVEKMVDGRIRKYLAEITLVGQPFVKNPDQTVADLLKAADATVVAFERFEVGEGVEKKVENFADEVMAQARGA